MPTYRTSLPAKGKHQGFDLKRTPETGSLQAIITSDDLLVCDTHFFHGRTTPCERLFNAEGKTIDDSHCPACVEKIAFRCHVYVSAFDAKKQEHFIFECTDNAAKALEEYKTASSTLRGCVIYATRPKGLKNSKVVIETSSVNLAKVKIPQPPDLVKALAVIWRLPGTAIATEKTENKSPTVKVNGKKIRNLQNQPDNIPDPETIGSIINERNLIEQF